LRQSYSSIGIGAKVLNEMSGQVESEKCILCEQAHVLEENREIDFRQHTDKGEVLCRVAVQFNVCPQCGFEYWDDHAEAALDEAVRQAYEKLV
jgi:uncharacterized protein with PIN domain